MTRAKLIQWALDDPQPRGLSDIEIETLSRIIREKFDIQIPDGYADFLKMMNGFSFNGFNVYCYINDDIKKNIDEMLAFDIIDANERFCDCADNDDYLLIGDSSTDYIAYIKKTKKYLIMSNGLDHEAEFDTFNEMFFYFINATIE